MSAPSKRKGYRGEMQALEALLPIFPGLKRTGSVAYTKAAADLEQDGLLLLGPVRPLRLIVTIDDRQQPLVTMSTDDLWALSRLELPDDTEDLSVCVQVKKRSRSWLGTVYRELVKATQ